MATLTIRSVIQVGDSLCVTLPMAWTLYYHIKQGDKVEVIEDRMLRVRPLRINRDIVALEASNMKKGGK